MHPVKPFMLSLLFVSLAVSAAAIEFSSFRSEAEALEWIAQNPSYAEWDKENMSYALRNSWWAVAEKMIAAIDETDEVLFSTFNSVSASIRTNLQRLQTVINGKKRQWVNLVPAFQWAQGFDDVSINMKFSHKWDNPATLGCAVNDVNLGTRSVHVDVRCPSAKKRFTLDIALTNDIVVDESNWSDASVGKLVINLRKAERGKWDNLFVKTRDSPRNVHPWWSMEKTLEKKDEPIYKEIEEKKKQEEIWRQNEEEVRIRTEWMKDDMEKWEKDRRYVDANGNLVPKEGLAVPNTPDVTSSVPPTDARAEMDKKSAEEKESQPTPSPKSEENAEKEL